MYDYECAHCGVIGERLVWPSQRNDPQHCDCGREMARVFVGRAPCMVPDSIPGGVVIENLTKQPRRYYSRSEIKLQAELAGAVPHVRHVGSPGSDKSKFTSRWV